MKRAIVTLLEGLIAVVMILCVLSGIILMMCETDDPQAQYTSMIFGFGLFIMGVLPGAIISAITTWKEKRANGRFFE